MKGGQHLLNKLERIKKAIDTDIPATINKVVEDRGKNAAEGFATADYTGDNDVSVTVDRTDENTWQINAEGTKVLFIEYGSGITWKHDSQFGNYSAYPPKSWSLGPNGKGWLSEEKIAKYHGWWRLPSPDGGQSTIFTNGNPSNNVMFTTFKAIRNDAEEGKIMRPLKEAMK